MRPHILLASTAALLIMTPGLASAKIDKQLKEELSGYVTQNKGLPEAGAVSAALLTWSHIATKKELKEIRGFMTHDDPRVRLTAGMALMSAGDRKAQKYLIEQLTSSTTLYVTLRDTFSLLDDKNEVKVLSSLLKNAKGSTRTQLLQYLAAQDGKLFDLVGKAALAKKPSELRSDALGSLKWGRGESAVALLPKLLKHKDPKVRRAGLELGVLLADRVPGKRAEVLSALSRAVGDKDLSVARFAAERLTALNDAVGVRKMQALANAQVKDAARAPLLEPVLAAGLRGVKIDRGLAAAAVKAAKTQEGKVLAYRVSLVAGDKKSIETLITFFGSNNYDERLLAAQTLGYSKLSSVAAYLARGLGEGNPLMRLYCAQGLKYSADASLLGTLRSVLQRERDTRVLRALVETIGAIKSKQSVQILRYQVSRGDAEYKKAVIKGLMNQGDPSIFSSLQLLLRDRDAGVKWVALLAVVTLNPAKAEPVIKSSIRNLPDTWLEDIGKLAPAAQKLLLQELVKHESGTVRAQVVGYMMERRGVYGDLLREQVSSPTMSVAERGNLLARLSQVPDAKDRAMLELLARTANQQKLKHQAAWSLVRHGETGSVATWRGLLSSSDPVIKSVAALGLAQSSKNKKK